MCQKLEHDLQILGVTAIEDRLQVVEELKDVYADLQNCDSSLIAHSSFCDYTGGGARNN